MAQVQRCSSPHSSSSRCGNTRLYYVKDGKYSVRMCKTAFLLMHGLSNGRMSRILQGIEHT